MNQHRKLKRPADPPQAQSPNPSEDASNPVLQTLNPPQPVVPGIRVTTFSTLVSGPPLLTYRTNDHRTVREEQTYVGTFSAPRDKRRYLTDHGIDLRYAEFDPHRNRWERCLFSAEVIALLVDLIAEGSFPYAFEAVPSCAELEWRVRRERGEVIRPELALYFYVTPASADALAAWKKRTGEALARRASPPPAVDEKRNNSGW